MNTNDRIEALRTLEELRTLINRSFPSFVDERKVDFVMIWQRLHDLVHSDR